jgi:bifunctional non-homologous end joining protein LigD
MAPHSFIRPCAPTLRRDPPAGPQWAHEIKWDGWRLQAVKEGATVRLISRPGNDLTDRLPAIAEAVAELPRRSVILDGELVAFGDDGRPDFRLLRRKRAAVVAFVFDIIESDGADLRSKPWRDRRVFLERLMARNKAPLLQLSAVFPDGPALLRAAGEQGLEGIVSKHRNAPYRSGHTDAWIKVKVPGWNEANRRRFKRR